MANLTNSNKIIDKIKDIESKLLDITNIEITVDNVVSDLSDFETEVANTYATKSDIASVYKYKASVATVSDLPSTDQTVGDVYNVEADGMNYAWNGSVWDPLGATVDLSNYATKQYVDDKIDVVDATIDDLNDEVNLVKDDVRVIENNITTLIATEVRSEINALIDLVANSLPFEAFYMDVTLDGVTTTVSNDKLTATSQISFVVKSGSLNGYYLEKEVAAGSATFTSSEAENATLEVLVINKKQ